MGVSCGLLPVAGDVVTELKAIELLSGAEATVISAGGLAGAEGAVVMVIKGESCAPRTILMLVCTNPLQCLIAQIGIHILQSGDPGCIVRCARYTVVDPDFLK